MHTTFPFKLSNQFRIYLNQQHWMDREQSHGPGIVREKVVHTETPGRVSHARCGEIENNRSGVSNQLSQTVVANAKHHWKLSESNSPPTGWKHVQHILNHVSHQSSNLAMAIEQPPTPSGSLRYLLVRPTVHWRSTSFPDTPFPMTETGVFNEQLLTKWQYYLDVG